MLAGVAGNHVYVGLDATALADLSEGKFVQAPLPDGGLVTLFARGTDIELRNTLAVEGMTFTDPPEEQ